MTLYLRAVVLSYSSKGEGQRSFVFSQPLVHSCERVQQRYTCLFMTFFMSDIVKGNARQNCQAQIVVTLPPKCLPSKYDLTLPKKSLLPYFVLQYCLERLRKAGNYLNAGIGSVCVIIGRRIYGGKTGDGWDEKSRPALLVSFVT